MSTTQVTIDLPFYVRIEAPLTVPYDDVCQEEKLSELAGRKLAITFSRRFAGHIDKSKQPPAERTTVSITVETPNELSKKDASTFAIRNCLEIFNRVITSYHAVTGEVSNAGFIFPLGTSDVQLFAEIHVDGRDIRDRWPFHRTNTFPLSTDQANEFKRYLTCQDDLPLSKLFLTNAILSLARGQYPLAVIQATTAVELRMTQYVVEKLKLAGWSDKATKPYEKMGLKKKLTVPKTDPRSLDTYFGGVNGFASICKQVSVDLCELRNRVAHTGYLAAQAEAKQAVEIAREFLKIVT